MSDHIVGAEGSEPGHPAAFRASAGRLRDEPARPDEPMLGDALDYADSILATLRDPFLVLDRDLRVKSANRAFYDKFHATPEETEGHLVYDLGDGQWNLPRLRELLDEVFVERRPIDSFGVEHEFPKIGKKVMLLNARPFPPDARRPELVLLDIGDITESHFVEHALKASEMQYRGLFEYAKDGILILDAVSGRILDANPYMSGLLGHGHEDLLGKQLWEIGLFRDEQENEAAFQELQQNGYVRYDHLPMTDVHGQQADVEFVSNLYEVNHKRVAQCNIRDISERTRMEAQMQAQAEVLADLHHRKDEFLAMLSHELRNPLAPIASALQLLRLQEGETPIQQHCIQVIDRQVAHLTQIVDDLLDVSRITTGRVRLRPTLADMRPILEGAVETVRPLFDERGHRLAVSMPTDPIWLNADPARLEQVLTNLLTNAAKYTENGGQVWLILEQEQDECVVRVRDTGVGIAPELLPSVFDLFTQAPPTLDRSQGGLGIGLSLVKRLTELHGGTVEAASLVGEGSEFMLRLPLAEPAALRVPETTSRPKVEAASALRVLVVDDNVDAAESLAMLVRASGHHAETAHDGPGAVQSAIQNPPNVVLLDIGLPGWNGYEVAERMRRHAALADTVLIAITGYGLESDRQNALDAGCDHHLVKPVDFAKIEQVLAGIR